MQKINLKKILPHIVAIVLFLVMSYVYFYPQIQGKTLLQSDMRNYYGMAREVFDYREATGEQILWTNALFGGMPAYLISVRYDANIFTKVISFIHFLCDRPANFIFMYLLGFYITLLAFKVDPWLSIAGAIAFALSSYFFIIIDAGHSSKANAIGYMAPIIAGVYLAYNKKILLGAIITGFFLAIQLLVNHLQITYYTFLIILVFVIFQFIFMFRRKEMMQFMKASAALIFVAMLAVGSNAGSILNTYEWGKDSMRGKSELTLDDKDNINKTTGLDKDYATSWSYGKAESFTLLIPNFMGGSSHGELSTSSDTYELLKQGYGEQAKQVVKQLPLYWGEQPFTSGPVYVGAIVCFFFILGLFIVKGHIKWWLLTITVLALFLAWGRNFMWFSEIFLDYFPGYNKFRTVSMILIIVEFTMPLLAILAIHTIFSKKITKEELMKPFKYTLFALGGLVLLLALLPGLFFDFTSAGDAPYQQNPQFLAALISDRESIFRTDAIRSLVFILLAAGIVYAFLKEKIKVQYAYLAFALLFLFDLWPICKRYMNSDSFVTKQEVKKPFQPSQANLDILQDKDPNFRVLNLAANTFNDASTSYFHKSVGGYHGAKLKRYQEMIEHHISKNNREVWNMLNTKYLIVPVKDQTPKAMPNPEALGNAWFVKQFRLVANADSEILALDKFKAAEEAIIDKRFENEVKNLTINTDTNAFIKLTSYHPMKLSYEAKATSDQLAVFSEIYYDKGWNAYLDGKLVPHIRANYILRAMKIPAGDHKIEFKFEPKSYSVGNKISLASSISLILLSLGIIVWEIIGKRKEEN
ncbi:MAG: hypothetical protein A2275_00405 [Bacteroidetes bacterium RIFOXYA12_FULL_35_11]|nr:MAG: hypothetical protein A2X01_04915 [Bacteroidetes bacterium GWF2_35_48]OFY79300.1 MAG: hypothetical protein A2275_00405 [Bacteroidetes bacterium RIFOXYA12_FULL_35_11]OFY92617.1 MAG: hypothetical protein A2309_00265 [Bacteroidetes bacterium RIFOXYB2_FULL_35_7]HBX51950.1 hypothetical protein [Bacteroidales bacterium]